MRSRKVQELLQLFPHMDAYVLELLEACTQTSSTSEQRRLLQRAYAVACASEEPYLADIINDLLEHAERLTIAADDR